MLSAYSAADERVRRAQDELTSARESRDRAVSRFRTLRKTGIIVCGIPRCGTTMVARAIAGLPPRSVWPSKDGAPVNGVWKYHKPLTDDFVREARAQGFGRGVFVFGDPVLSAISTRRARWDQNHAANMGSAEPIDALDIYRRDALGHERLFDSWTSPHEIPVLALRYDALWANEEALRGFTGRDVRLPPRRERRTTAADVDAEDLRAICETYAGLIRKVAGMTDLLAIGWGGYD